MNPVRQLLAKRISELRSTGLTMAEVSRQLERNPAYLQQFISRGVPTELDERDRHKLAEILQLNPEELRGPGRTRKWQRAIEWRPEPGTPVGHGQSGSPVFREDVFVSHRKNEELASHLTELLQALSESKKQSSIDSFRSRHKGFLPVYRLVEDDKSLRIGIQARTLLPKEVSSNFGNNAYGVVIVDDLMAPELRTGGIAIADPDLPPRPRTTCIFRKGNVDEGGEVLVRRLYEISEENFQVYSYVNFANALNKFERGLKLTKQNLELPKFETLSRKAYPHCHVIVGALSPPVT
jgi:hypothetical protein